MRVTLEHDYARLREKAYQQIGDGTQIDAFAKALAEIIEANPSLNGPGVQEVKKILEQRAEVKRTIPKPEELKARREVGSDKEGNKDG